MFDWLAEKIDKSLVFIREFFSGIWNDFYNFISELPAVILEQILNALSAIFTSISAPSFLQSGLTSLFSSLPDSVIYFLTQAGFFQGLAIFGTGVTFRLTRKLLTLGQW